MYRILVLTLFTFILSGCSTLGFKGGSQAPRNNSPRKIIALYQKTTTSQENIQLAFVSDHGNWYNWKTFSGIERVSYITKRPNSWIASYKGKTLTRIASNPSTYNTDYGKLSLPAPVTGLVEAPLVQSEIAYPGLAGRPIVLQNITSEVPYADPLWKRSTPPKRTLEYTLSAFDNFIESGIIERNTLAVEDLHLIDGILLQNGDRILTIAVQTLSNCTEYEREKRFKSFYIRNGSQVTDLTAGHDVDLTCARSTGLDIRFVDVIDHQGDIAILFWYWTDTRKGYRLYVPRINASIDMDLSYGY